MGKVLYVRSHISDLMLAYMNDLTLLSICAGLRTVAFFFLG